MKIICIGGGPAGLYFAILMKKADPTHDITVFERNRPDDTFGWGVVFSRETLAHFQAQDAPSYERITHSFRYWDNIDTFYQGACVTSTGHGFCGLSRRRLLNILQDRCTELGITLNFQTEVDPEHLPPCDLLVAADGVASRTRERYSDAFRPSIAPGRCRFTWLGSSLPLSAFTFIYRRNEHGLFQVHAYPYEPGRSTFIVECHEDVWGSAGLDRASEDDTIAYCERLFHDDLRGHRLLSNRSIWRTFPIVTNERWHHDHIVLMGDAAHTAHFSIGSGTKLAMEDAIALHEMFQRQGAADIPQVLSAYEAHRRPPVLRLQRAALVSQRWFEQSARFQGQDPLTFTFNQLTRSMRISWENLRVRDPAFVDRVQVHFAATVPRNGTAGTPTPIATPFRLRQLDLPNRIVSALPPAHVAHDDLACCWHLGALGHGGPAGLILTQAVAVSTSGGALPLIQSFARAAILAAVAGADLVMLDMGQGSSLGPAVAPHGPPLQVLDAVRAAFPPERPVAVRLGGLSAEDAVAAARLLKEHGCDLIFVTGGGIVHDVPLSAQIRLEADLPTMVGGEQYSVDDCNTILAAGRADLCLLTSI